MQKMRSFSGVFFYIFLIYLLSSSTVQTRTICVSEDSNCTSLSHSCRSSLCHPLEWFVSNYTILDNTVIFFVAGNHSLQNSTYIISDKHNLTIVGNGRANYQSDGVISPSSVVLCSGSQSGIFVTNSSEITLRNIEFRGCVVRMPVFAKCQLSTSVSYFEGGLFFLCSNHVTLIQVLVKNSTGFGVHFGDACGIININDSAFIANNGGNTAFWFKICNNNDTGTYLNIRNTKIFNGMTESESEYEYAPGLSLFIYRPQLNITLTNVVLRNNKGSREGGNLAIKFVDFAENTSHIAIDNCIIEYGVSEGFGGGLSLWFEKNFSDNLNNYAVGLHNIAAVVTLTNTTFRGNKANDGAALAITYHERPGMGYTIRQVKFTDCIFLENNATRGSAMQISKHNLPKFILHSSPQFMVVLNNCLVSNNTLTPKHQQNNENGIIEVFSMENIVIQSCNFTDNLGTALLLVNSAVRFYNNTIFRGNSAQYGGAIKVCDASKMYFNSDTHVRFIDNSAESAGGAIYASNQCPQETPPCFFQIIPSKNATIISEITRGLLYFDGNHAGIAGHAIYGGSVDSCFTDNKLSMNSSDKNKSYFYSAQLYNQTFNFSNISQPSLVTSDPYGVCQCSVNTNVLNCLNRTISVGSLYPGQFFNITVSAVGQTYGSVPSAILVESPDVRVFTVRQRQKPCMNITNQLCQTIEVAIFAEEDVGDISFNVGIVQLDPISESSNYYHIPKLKVNATVNPCPFLFQLINKSSICDCPKELSERGFTCDINTETIAKPAAAGNRAAWWIGCELDPGTGICNTTQWSKKCQEERCSNKANFTKGLVGMCVVGRDGRLCGKCNSNYSLSIGLPICVQTDSECRVWKTILLLVIFILAGIALVGFLAVLNMTVTEGTLNGLLFYANCVHANQDIFYNKDLFSYKFLQMVISWLNLDFGFQVCFYSGMTAYQKIWLEFGFLFYLLLLGVLIVCLSRRFVWFTRLAGRNVVPVLATVILFAYPKLVRNCIKVWECTNNKFWSSDSRRPWTWYLDESVDCYSGKHLVLFILSIILFTIAFCYTLCLLLIQCLQRRSNWFVLRWVDKLRPFFDANIGHCRDHYRFWPGLLLFTRLGLYVTFWHLNSHQKAYLTMGLSVFIFFLACVSSHGVYKKWPINLLEFSFFLNLAISTATVAEKHPYRTAFSDTSITIAIVILILIIGYHSYKKIETTRTWGRLVSRMIARRNSLRAILYTEGAQDVNTQPINCEQGMRPLLIDLEREPLLFSGPH